MSTESEIRRLQERLKNGPVIDRRQASTTRPACSTAAAVTPTAAGR